MKYLIFVLTISLLQPVLAGNKLPVSIQSNQLKIFACDHTGNPISNPENWLQFYEHEDNTIENRIYITATFNIENIVALAIIDINAGNNKCEGKQKKYIIYLAFNPNDNVKKITTRIHKPCFIGNKTTLKLNVKTKEGKRFYNIVTLKSHPNAFDPVSQ